MLSRGATDASSRLRRSKSSASVTRPPAERHVPKSVDPETAHRDALTAAHIAMNRANGRASADMRRSAELSRNESCASEKGLGAASRSQNTHFRRVVVPRRQRSAFQINRRSVASPLAMPTSTSCSALSNMGTGPPLNELGLADGYGSAPSSYRRLRKTKSMSTPRTRGRCIQETSSQSPCTPRTLRNARSSLSDQDHALRLGLKRSMSFLKLGSGNLSKPFKRSHSVIEHNDAAVERAREHFRQDVQQQRLQTRPSFLSTAKLRQHRVLRKTVRSNRSNEYGDSVRLDCQELKQDSKIRSFSASLRDRVRRVLGTSSSKPSYLPAQQLDARRAHFRDYLDGTDTNSGLGDYTTGDVRSSSHDSIYLHSPRTAEAVNELEAVSKGLRSMHSKESLQSNGQSRVSSWANSTVTNSVPGRGTPVGRKRLSIIQEHGAAYEPSSSVGRHMNEVSADHLPLHARRGKVPLRSPIDSHRVYSALMRRMDQDKEDHDQSIPPRAEDLRGSGQNNLSRAQSFQTAPTIRHVASEESFNATSLEGDDEDEDDHHPHNHRSFDLHPTEWQESPVETTSQFGRWNELVGNSSRSQDPVQEDYRRFSPFSSENKWRTVSPLQLAIAAHRKRQNKPDEENGTVIITRPSRTDDSFETLSESQYSRTTSGQQPTSGMHRLDPEVSGESISMATVPPSAASQYPRPNDILAHAQKFKSNASVEFHSRTKLPEEELDHHNFQSGVSHYREDAQIDGSDLSVGMQPGSFAGRGGRCSAGTAQENLLPDQRLNAPTRYEHFPLIELKDGPRNNIPKPRRSFSAARMVNSAAADVKKASLRAMGVNDENARFSPMQRASPHALQALSSPCSPKETEQPFDRLNGSNYQHHPEDPGIGRPPSSATIKSQYGQVMGASKAEGDTICQKPLDEKGLGNSGPKSGGRRLSFGLLRSTDHNGDNKRNGDAPQNADPIETKAARGHRLAGMGKPMTGKRMVSNFLRSRRRNGSAAGTGLSSSDADATITDADSGSAFI